MKITIIGPVHPYRGGIAHHTALLSEALTTHNHHIDVISFIRQFPGWLYPGTSDKDPSKQPVRTEAEFILDPLYPWTWLRAARYIRDLNPDLVVFQWWTTFWAVPYRFISSQLVRNGHRVVFLVHNVLPHEEKIWDRWLAKFGLGSSDAFIVQNPRERDRMLAHIPAAEINICKIPIYPPLADINIDRTEARKHLSLTPGGPPIILFFGIVRDYKGLDVLLNALSCLHVEDQKPMLLIAGEFWDSKTDYRSMIGQLGIKDQVIIDDRYIPNEEVGIYFSAADLLVAPYIAGTQSAVTGLALSYGLPMIVSDTIAEGIYLTGSEHVRIVRAGDPGELATVIAEVIRELPEIRRVPTSAQADWERMVKVIEELAK